MGSHSVTCHLTQVNAPRLTSALQAGTQFTYPGGMEGWVDLVDLARSRTSDLSITSPTPNRCTTKTMLCRRSFTIWLSSCSDLYVFNMKVKMHLNSLPHTVSQLLSFSLERLESDIGHDLVATSLSLLACSRAGKLIYWICCAMCS